MEWRSKLKQLTPKNSASPHSSTLSSLFQPVSPLTPKHAGHTTSCPLRYWSTRIDQPTPRDYLGFSPFSPIVVPNNSVRRFLDACLAESVPSVISDSHWHPVPSTSVRCTAGQFNLRAFATSLYGFFGHPGGLFDLSISEEFISHFYGMLCIVACRENSLRTVAIYLVFFSESLLFES